MIILASGSPRRRELISHIFSDYEVIKSEKDEIVTKTEPSDIVTELSKQKAMEVWNTAKEQDRLNDDRNLLIAADTLVFLKNKRMGKPLDKEDAINMLTSLSGNEHQVYTGVTLFWGNKDSFFEKSFFEATKVFCYDISREDIEKYVASGEPMDKAGAYAIQGGFAKHIKGIEGEYANVVGLPVARLYQEIKNIGGFIDER